MVVGYVAERCSGCRACELVCALCNRSVNNPRASAIRVRGQFPAPGHYDITVCNQCGVCGVCAAVCPTGAIYEEGGVYLIDADRCDRCWECVEACPLDAIFVSESGPPIKCTACGECIAGCPLGVLHEEV